MKKVYSRPKSLKRVPFHYCPGCGHSIVHRLLTEVFDEMKLQDKAIGIPPPGCSVFTYHYLDVDMAESALGEVKASTLFIVGGEDTQVLALNRQALEKLETEKHLEVVPGAGHLFEEPGALDEVARLAREWFERHLTP